MEGCQEGLSGEPTLERGPEGSGEPWRRLGESFQAERVLVRLQKSEAPHGLRAGGGVNEMSQPGGEGAVA